MTATNKTIPTQEDVIDLLDYSPATGNFVWRKSGGVAGCETANGYTVIGINGRLYLAHRLAWLVVHG